MIKLPENLPSTNEFDKKALLEILQREVYGQIPPMPEISVKQVDCTNKYFFAGKADLLTLAFTVKADFGVFTFPLYYARPKNQDKPVPAFIHINFRDAVPDRYQPTEELLDAGFATLTFCYNDITSDNRDFSNGLAGVMYKDGKQTENGCGKIGMWAWIACAVLEYALTLPELDHSRISVCGHSRLGKTALLAGALDERFYCAFSNCSGCGGASLERNKDNRGAERIADIIYRFDYWFCKKYASYVNNEEAMPLDQHFLIAANYPHKVYVASAANDAWACPENEYLACVAADEYYKRMGSTGFIHPDRIPEVGESFHDGDIAYHIREGEHFFSRTDWLRYVEYLNKCFAD